MTVPRYGVRYFDDDGVTKGFAYYDLSSGQLVATIGTWITGKLVPANDLGKEDNYYIQTTTQNVYYHNNVGWILIGNLGASEQIVKYWFANTEYKGTSSSKPSIIFKDGYLYLVVADFTTGSTFSTIHYPVSLSIPEIALVEIYNPSPKDYIEIIVGAITPLFSMTEIGSYITTREITLRETYNFPVSEVTGTSYHACYVNSGITQDVELKIFVDSSVSTTEIGTVNFSSSTTSDHVGIAGTINLNASSVVIPKNSLIRFVIQSVNSTVTRININLLGEFPSFKSLQILS